MDLYGQLLKAFPRFFIDANPDLVGDIGTGWHSIVLQLFSRIDAALSDEEAQNLRFVQIKEKLGGLRVYVRHNSGKATGLHGERFPDQIVEPPIDTDELAPAWSTVRFLIAAAEEEAARTCEECGRPGRLRAAPRIQVLCKVHAPHLKAGQRVAIPTSNAGGTPKEPPAEPINSK